MGHTNGNMIRQHYEACINEDALVRITPGRLIPESASNSFIAWRSLSDHPQPGELYRGLF